MFKPVLAVVSGVALAGAVFAADVALNPDRPDTYVVKKGDTLWDIAGRFLSKPWQWPEIWQANPQVANPHLIYPGDVLTLVYINGQPRLVRNGEGAPRGDSWIPPSGPRVRAEPLEEAVTTIPLGAVAPFLEKTRVYAKGEVDTLPYVLATEEDRLMGTPGQTIYVRGIENAEPGSRITVVRASYDYYNVPKNYPWRDAERYGDAVALQGDPVGNRPDWYWKAQLNRVSFVRDNLEHLGTEVVEIASGEVLRGGDPATVLLTTSEAEVREGDRVVAGGALPFDLRFAPKAPERVPDGLTVMALSGEALAFSGPDQVVALSRGSDDGVEVGQVYSVFEPGRAVRDDTRYPAGSFKRLVNPKDSMVELPGEFAGHVMVFRTFDKVSYALIMDGIRPVRIGHELRAPVE
jgi:hypothetical protein